MAVGTWVGIALCLSQSAVFSGLNLAYFSVSKLRLEVEVAQGNKKAKTVQRLRENSNFLLTTILWGNVGINVLLTLLSNSVLAGVGAFLFSTVVITLIGEIIPQAYFSRHALNMGHYLSPVIRFYQIVLYVVARPTALLLDSVLGKESIGFFQEADLRHLIQMHIESESTDIAETEGTGALNFLEIDDVTAGEEGEAVDPLSVIELPCTDDCPVFPALSGKPDDPFLQILNRSGRKWVIVVDQSGAPRAVLNADGFVRGALFESDTFSPNHYCHQPVVVTDPERPIGDLLLQLEVDPEHHEDDVIDEDIILLWTDSARRIITGSDILGRLLRGIVSHRGGDASRKPT